MIHYEHKHITYAEQYDLINRLENLGYSLFLEKYDTTAVLK